MIRVMSERIARFLAEQPPDTPCLVVDLDLIAAAYEALRHYLPLARIYYAVKAKPAAEIVGVLNRKCASFDVASRGEIALCLGNRVAPDRLSFGNTIKKEKDIAYAYQAGVRLFAFDSAHELEKLARAAPGASVFCRILVTCDGPEWPLSLKFSRAPQLPTDLPPHTPNPALSPPTIP